MEPGHEDREYAAPAWRTPAAKAASMEPGHEDREYILGISRLVRGPTASMEPGHEDREYLDELDPIQGHWTPQWSPVMKTGNTHKPPTSTNTPCTPQWSPVMKTGNTRGDRHAPSAQRGLNGARS